MVEFYPKGVASRCGLSMLDNHYTIHLFDNFDELCQSLNLEYRPIWKAKIAQWQEEHVLKVPNAIGVQLVKLYLFIYFLKGVQITKKICFR